LSPRTSRTFAPIPANRASSALNSDTLSALQTCEQIIRLKIPNLLRLYLNPFVAQTCVALAEMVPALWPGLRDEGRRPSFLANSGEEALSGAIKLARYTQNVRSRNDAGATGVREFSPTVYLIDNGRWFNHFASTSIDSDLSENRVTVEFLPQIVTMTTSEFVSRLESDEEPHGILVLSPAATGNAQPGDQFCSSVRRFCASGRSLMIACVDRERFAEGMKTQEIGLVPEIVVFDETFTMNQVPFGAFTARRDLYEQWTAKGMTNFHSTTFQPNTISTMHFLKCLQEHSARFSDELQPSLKPLLVDSELLRETFRDLFSPALARLISAVSHDSEDVTASAHYVRIGSKLYFDGVGGVACSLRGHNPATWVEEIKGLDTAGNIRNEVSQRLAALTGLQHHVPAVSGAAAVEHALKLALAAQFPRSVIVALKGGFGGKTLLALSGTSKSFYRENLDPLYANVLYLDPFAEDAVAQLRLIAETTSIAVIQLELIQGVGGVRELPDSLLDCIQGVRQRTGALLFVDEIQTGMFRTGSFVRSVDKSIRPDLLTIGKGTSDMMFPFAFTLFSDRIHSLLKARQNTLASDLEKRYSFELGYRAMLNTLRRADRDDVGSQVLRAGQQFHEALTRHLSGIAVVKEVRCYGLLIGIELNCQNSLLQRLGLNAAQLYLLQMMNHRDCPVLIGFCQYEPHILKFTPPLNVTDPEVEAVCKTIADTLRTSTVKMLLTGFSALLRGRK